MGNKKKEPKNFEETFFSTVYISFTKSRVRPDFGDFKQMLDYFSTKSYLTYHYGLNTAITTKFQKAKRYYTIEDLNDEDATLLTRGVTHVLLLAMTSKDNSYNALLREKTALIDYLDDITQDKSLPHIQDFINSVEVLSDGTIHLSVVVEDMVSFTKVLLKAGNLRCIELPGMPDKKYTLQDAIVLGLSRDRSTLPRYYKNPAAVMDKNGFIEYESYLKGVFDQHYNAVEEKAPIVRFVTALGEMDFTGVLSEEKILAGFIKCKDTTGILSSLKDEELKPLAEYFYNLAVRGNQKPFSDVEEFFNS